ncbi:MAG: aminopeptidase P family protein [Clostridiales bacterium]|nr:aminopeptidase P family protein [Clostridiales bacterium]
MSNLTVKKRINKLRETMVEEGISLYMITTMDFHMSEMTNGYFKTLKYMSGFTGSEGKMIITENNVHLWTDGRYAIQSVKELEGTDIHVHIYSDRSDELRNLSRFFILSGDKMFTDAIEKAPSKKVIVANNDYVIGCDGRTFSENLMQDIKESMHIAYDSGMVKIKTDLDLVGEVWEGRPKLPKGKIYRLSDDIAGVPAAEKIKKIRGSINLSSGNIGYVCSSLDDIAWLLNLRGNDIEGSPVFLSYLYMGSETKETYLFVDSTRFGYDVNEYLKELGVEVYKYDEFYEFLENVDVNFVAINPSKSNAAIIDTLENREDVELLEVDGLIENSKSIKNPVEIANTKRINKLDAVAMIKFMKWLKENVGKVEMTEISAADYLELLRKEQGCFELSFDTICGYGANGAIIHYTATDKSNAKIVLGNLLLVDSGGHYMGGTTDITRTFALGEISEEMKKHYTVILSGMLELGMAEFPMGVTSAELDIYARAPIWKHGIDYDHGTGHGIGYMLNVHEGPQIINYKRSMSSKIMLPGMITSNEPGMYIESQYGIRHENDMLCVEKKNGLLGFEYMTLVPFDIDAIDVKYLNEAQRKALNDYHKNVYEKISPSLSEEEKDWLKRVTQPL